MQQQLKNISILGICLFLYGCISTGNNQPPVLVLQDHVLVNKILDVKAGRIINEAQLNQRIVVSDYLLLGETHDNIRHHQLQARVIDTLRQQQRDTSVSFEMITDEQGELLNRHKVNTSSALISILNQFKSSWYYETQYRIVFDSALTAGFELRAANLSRTKLSQMMKQGEAKLPHTVKPSLTKVPLSKKQLSSLQREIVKGHCDMIPVEATGPMVLAQRIRDAVMSQSLLQSKHTSKVLIAGTGHTRNDRGVPLYLRKLDKGAKITSIGFMEVDAGVVTIEPYLQHHDGETLPFDYIWFTPDVEREDPCLRFKHKK